MRGSKRNLKMKSCLHFFSSSASLIAKMVLIPSCCSLTQLSLLSSMLSYKESDYIRSCNSTPCLFPPYRVLQTSCRSTWQYSLGRVQMLSVALGRPYGCKFLLPSSISWYGVWWLWLHTLFCRRSLWPCILCRSHPLQWVWYLWTSSWISLCLGCCGGVSYLI